MTLIYQVQPTSSGWNRTLHQRHAQVTDQLYHLMLYRLLLARSGFQTHNFSKVSWKSNNHTITMTMAPEHVYTNYICNTKLNIQIHMHDVG